MIINYSGAVGGNFIQLLIGLAEPIAHNNLTVICFIRIHRAYNKIITLTVKPHFRTIRHILIDGPASLLGYDDSENFISHTYDVDMAEEVYGTAIKFIKDAANC